MKVTSLALFGLCLVFCSCGGDDGGGGSGGSSTGGSAGAGGASTGGASTGGSAGAGGASTGGGAGSGGSSAIDAPGDCLPSEQAGDHCADATYQYEYFCMPNGSPEPPATGCQQPTSPLPAGSGWCCSVALCQRQKGTEYLCTNAAKPNSYLCHSAAPAPAGCDSVGSIGQQYCCP